jgi:putative phosphoribosyl transferase
MFSNRRQAGEELARTLKRILPPTDRSGEKPARIVVGLPRGGVIVAAQVARELQCSLDIFMAKKIGALDNPELAVGAVSSTGVVVLDERMRALPGAGRQYSLPQEQDKQPLIESAHQKEEDLLAAAGVESRPLSQAQGSEIIVVDDGIATGMTAIAALRSLAEMGAASLILAVPVIPYDTYLHMQKECHEVIALKAPFDFSAVGLFYRDFSQVEDGEVIEALKDASGSQPNRSVA